MKLVAYRFECVLLICFLQLTPIYCAKILGFFGSISRSHFIVEESVMRELAKRGHEVTVVTTFKQSGEKLENYRYIEVPDMIDPGITSLVTDTVRSDGESKGLKGFLHIFTAMNKLVRVSQDIMRHPKFQPLKNETFDLLIVGWFLNEYVLGLSGHFECPSVVISPNVNIYATRRISGNPSSVSTVPSILSNINADMTIFPRIKNLFAHLAEFVMMEAFVHFYIKPIYLEEFPTDMYPSYDEVEKNVSLILLTQHFSGRTPEPLLPGVIEVEGMHVKKEPSPLPQDIKEFLDSATDGAIFFSFGSNAKSSDIPQEKLTVLLNKFGSLKQKILWKFETDLPNLPENVKISKWLPQDDILAHKNVKLFISHCGKGGITESKYHGVPILGIPLFADQFGNARHIVSEGWAVMLPFDDLNKATFSETLDEALNNPKYTQIAKKLSELNRDRPEHPLYKAAFWIEYVIRHNGAKHMQSPAVHMNLLQYYMVDVFAFLFLTLYIGVWVLKIAFKAFWSKMFGVGKKRIKKE